MSVFVSRSKMLAALTRMGAGLCCYLPGACDPEAWAAGARCDCKYGGGKPLLDLGEQTGCPELRALYLVLQVMDDDDWEGWVRRAGGVTAEQIADSLGGPA